MRVPIVLLVGLVGSRQGLADPEPALRAAGDTFDYRRGGPLAVDAGLIVGFPAALPTGLSRGAGVGIARGDTLAWGARAAWVTATESTMAWTVTHSDLRLRATGELRHAAGRGTLGVRLGLGGTLVHESRSRNQGERAGLSGSALATSAWAMLPAADLEATVGVAVIGCWSLQLAGGPSIALRGGDAHASWAAQLGVAWRP
jgi:hypothetical protein